MRVLISGAGLAGLTTAYWLRHYGHQPVLVEVAPGLRLDGYGIDFFGTGYDVAELMGIIEELGRRPLFMPGEAGIAFVDADGKAQAELRIDTIRETLDGRYLPLMHGDLVATIAGVLQDDVDVRYGISVTAFETSDTGVEVTLSDGTTETFDLLAGADGIHSNVRALAFGPEADFAHFMGYYVASYFVPATFERTAAWDNYVEPGHEVGLYSSNDPERLVTLFLWQSEDDGPIPADQRGARLRQAFAGVGWKTAALLDAMPADGHEILMDNVTQIHMETWRSGRVVLVGDAAGCMTLISGQGASMALASGYVLAEELGREPDVAQALANYEHRVKPHIEERQDNARAFAKRFVPGSQTGVRMQTALMKLITYQAFSGLLKKQFMGDSFLRTAALHRLPDSAGNVVGYRVAGKLGVTDYQTLSMDLEEVLKSHVDVRLLLRLEDLGGIELRALWSDWQLGREFHDHIERLAVVGDGVVSAAVGSLAKPLYAREARHFGATQLADAWAWLRT
jgi:2-polyprenyl-6-methoxyphenol hydroxylase-like FAD-dependent oxidoreductase